MDKYGFLVFLILFGALVAAGFLGARWVQKPGYRLLGALVLVAIAVPLIAAIVVAVWRAIQ